MKNKEYCPICKDNTSEEEKKMIQCSYCQMWIHQDCDSYLKNGGYLKYENEIKNNTIIY